MRSRNDVEKSWHDRGSFRHAVAFTFADIAAALIALIAALIWASNRAACAQADSVLCDGSARTVVLFLPALVLLIGGLIAFGKTYLVWRNGGAWPIWQGAGWVMFVCLLLFLGVGGGVLAQR
ncbi:hypothetical protein FOS14_11970 [Skermania sp. ID1734]|nr:hypothetical protein FOS14_11970 [Skermania sp. ID1734]